MDHEVRVEELQPRILAAVRRTATPTEVKTTWRPALDLVWAYLARHPGLRDDGHNVFLYHHTAPAMPIDFGVEVTRRFEGDGEVGCVVTPAGQAAVVVHRGDYSGLPAAHDAIRRWCAANGRTIGGFSLEIYGDWFDDVTRVETTIAYAL